MAAGRDHYFLEYGTYSCDDSNGKPPFAGSQLENRPEYAKPLGEPEPTQLISSFVTREQLLPTHTHTSSEEEVVVGEVIREAVPQCECLVGNTLTTEGAAAAPPPDKYAGSCMEWDHSCEQCQAGVDRRCSGGGGPWCNSPCVFLSEPVCSMGECNQCQPLAWVNKSCPGKLCGNATACKNGTCAGSCAVNRPPPLPAPTSPSANTTSLWLGTTDLRPPAGTVANLTEGASRCECVFKRKFASGTQAYYNATTWRVGGSAGAVDAVVVSSSASCVLWSDNSSLDSAGGCAELRALAAGRD